MKLVRAEVADFGENDSSNPLYRVVLACYPQLKTLSLQFVSLTECMPWLYLGLKQAADKHYET